MSFLDRLLGRTPQTQTLEVEATGKRTGISLWGRTYRRGMWVIKDNHVGILKDVTEEGIATVMLVKTDGTDLLEVATPVQSLVQAYLREIPESRRPDEDVGRRLGYT